MSFDSVPHKAQIYDYPGKTFCDSYLRRPASRTDRGSIGPLVYLSDDTKLQDVPRLLVPLYALPDLRARADITRISQMD